MLNGKFEDVVAIADECYRLQDRIYNGKYNEIGIEVRKRLKQLDKLLDIAIDLHNNLISIKKQTDPPKTLKNIDEMHEWLEQRKAEDYTLHLEAFNILNELELYAEAFYWFAFRLRSIVKLLPGLRNFESEGIRNVRNKLIEHPEGKDSKITIASFAAGGECGPVFKALRYQHQVDVFADRGLFMNASEIIDNLKRAFENYPRNHGP